MSLKKIATLLLASVMTLSFAACSKTKGTTAKENQNAAVVSPAEGASDEHIAQGAEKLEAAKMKIQDLKSYDANMGLYFEFVNNDGNSSAKVDTTIESLSDPMLKHITIDSTSEGQSIGSSQFYVKEENDEKNIFMLFQDEWYKSPVDDNTLFYLLGQYDLREITSIFLAASSDAVSLGEESVDGLNTTKVEAVINADVLPDTLINTGIFVAAGMATLTDEHLAGVNSMLIDYWIDEEGNVVRYQLDAGSAYQKISDNLFAQVEGTEGYEDAKKLIVNSYAIDIHMKDINEAKRFEIAPEALKAKAIEDMESVNTESTVPQKNN